MSMMKGILHLGPSGRGGIDTVIRIYKELDVKGVNFYFVPTTSANRLFAPFYFFRACLCVFFNALIGNIIQLHTASNGSFIRKYTLSCIARILGGKYIAHIHGANFLIYYNSSGSRGKSRIISYLKNAEKVIVLSSSWKDFMSAWDTGKNNFIVIPNPCPEIFAKRQNNAVNKIRLLFSGRIGRRKGVYDLVSAMALVVKQNPNITLDIYGDGELHQLALALVEKKLTSHVRIFSWIEHQSYLKLIPEYDLFVMPSYSESFGMSVVEAMIAGLPVITSPVGAIPEFVEDGYNGCLIPPGNVELLSETIISMCANSEKIKVMGQRAKLRVQSYCSLEKVTTLLNECYKSIKG